MPGCVVICGTPIGNLGDMTPRAVDALRSANLILAEDTRQTHKLLAHHGIKGRRLVSCHEHNERDRVPLLLEVLEAGGQVVVVSDAGTPLISDPGHLILQAALDAGAEVTAVPGPCAAIVALVLSGLPTVPFTFLGFLPRSSRERVAMIERAAGAPETQVLYEAPHRIAATLEDLVRSFGADRRAAVARELTKLHEETTRGTLGELAVRHRDEVPRGEYVIVVEGAPPVARQATKEAAADQLAAVVEELVVDGLSASDAIKAAARLLGVPRRLVYRAYQEVSRRNDGSRAGS